MIISQKKIAEMLGITQATVSRALNDNPRISPELKKRVRELCNELGYVPDFSAISLASGRTKSISVLLPSPDRLLLSDLHSRWVTHLHREAMKRGYRLRVDHITAYERTVLERSADGFILIGTNSDILEQVSQCPVPIVHTDCYIFQTKGVVSIDNLGGMATAVRHLLELGHERIVFFGSQVSTQEVGVSFERYMGYRSALEEVGIKLSEDFTVPHSKGLSEVQEAFGYEEPLMRAIDLGATAIVASSDINAVGAVHILLSRGLRIPEDISVIGFDDSLLARSWNPPLTTVLQDVAPASEKAIEMLVSAIDGNAMAPSVLIPAPLLVRGTTAKRR